MATFINNAQDFLGAPFGSTEDFFTDDNGLVPHEPNINGIAAAGIAQGTSATTYDPTGSVSRNQMASFIIRYLAVLENAGVINSLPAEAGALGAVEFTDTDGNGALSTGDEIVLTFDGPVVATSSITISDEQGDSATLTDDEPTPEGATPATFEESEDGTEVTVTVGSPLVVNEGENGDGVIDGAITVDGCEGNVTDPDGDGAVDEGDTPVTCEGDVGTEIPESEGTSGVITSFDNDANSYTFVAEGGEEPVTVVYDTDDTFTVNGGSATIGAFESALDVGDEITFDDDPTAPTDADTHALTNVDPDDVAGGTIGNIDVSDDEFDFIEPVTGVTTVNNRVYTGALYSVDGTTVNVGTFEDDLNEGDVLLITTDAEGDETFALTNQTVEGIVTDVDGNEITIDNLGDDPLTDQDTAFDVVDGSGDNEYFIEGDEATEIEFLAALSEGDEITYEREDDTQVFSIENVAPPAIVGIATEEFDDGTDTFTMVLQGTDDDAAPIDYTDVETFRIDDSAATLAEFETDYTPGDVITYTPDDPGTGADEESIHLSNEDLEGEIGDVDTDNDTYDVLNAEGGVIYDDLSYVGAIFGGTDEYFVNDDPAADLAEFEAFLTEIAEDAPDPSDTVTVVDDGANTEHRIDTDEIVV
jgi:hypothetical protein